MLSLPIASYREQIKVWPQSGKHILAHHDAETIMVYQAYNPIIGNYAARHGYFGGEFKYARMSWIKPNFLWMMYRSAWGTAQGQEVVLGIRLRRTFFDALLDQAVASSFPRRDRRFQDQSEWQQAVQQSDVRIQWDPDHDPTGKKCERRAVQLGLRGAALEQYGKKEVLEILDMSEFVAAQRPFAATWDQGELQMPVEQVYVPEDPQIARQVGIDLFS
ncbi:hypothetical protein Pan153_28750 [Gimesia panareensis]|uniref:DUF4291 domain-containing protein n=1 Tax=Gimesia panareensis TaxID=2527978 RepID=A0A518FPD8_9PLAN|nr:DUF4291 domain-containing protein [Gimesia panareensis]QDV18218.1 hypothetical protein Pan153_28750 [Gimesia panareensis]